MKAKRSKVMIIEDDILLSIIEERLVKRLGFHVVAKSDNGMEALKKIKTKNPEIILMDVQLSGELSGLDVMEKLRKEGNNVPIIFISGNRSEEVLSRTKNVECIEFLMKPITATELERPLKKISTLPLEVSPFAA